jgi:hypothetical protein
MAKKPDEQFSEKKAQQRFEAALRGALKAPHKPLKESPRRRRPRPQSRALKVKKTPPKRG